MSTEAGESSFVIVAKAEPEPKRNVLPAAACTALVLTLLRLLAKRIIVNCTGEIVDYQLNTPFTYLRHLAESYEAAQTEDSGSEQISLGVPGKRRGGGLNSLPCYRLHEQLTGSLREATYISVTRSWDSDGRTTCNPKHTGSARRLPTR